MEELIAKDARWAIGITQDSDGTDIHFVLSDLVTIRLSLEYFLKRLFAIEEPIHIHTGRGILHIVPVDKYRCELSFDDRHSPDARIVHHRLGVIDYKDLLTAINMELNTLRLRDRREEVFKRPRRTKDGGFFW